MSFKPDKVVLTSDEIDLLFQKKFTDLMNELGSETGKIPLGAISLIVWPEQELNVSVAVAVANVKPSVQLRIIDAMAGKFAKAVSTIKSQINRVKTQ